MDLYLAGNFIALSNIDKEREVLKLTGLEDYHRLVSFYYPKTVQVVMDLQKEVEDDRDH